MLESIEKLLILQDRDRNLNRTRAELDTIGPEQEMAQIKCASSKKALEEAKLKYAHLEARKKELELEVDSEKQRIDKYSNQQLQTKKNEEYKALKNEIDGCEKRISGVEDTILELMEESDAAKAVVSSATRTAAEVQKRVDDQVAELAELKKNLDLRLAELESNRDELASAVEAGVLAKYERLLKQRGDNIVVGIEHGVCGGCHMKLTAQIMVDCRQQEEVPYCPHCGRILYYTRDMELEPA